MIYCICESNDSILVDGTVFEKLTTSVDTCLSHTDNAMTNWADVTIAKWITLAIVIIVAIGVIGYILVKLMDTISSSCALKQKRKWEVEDKKQTQYADLLHKKLEYLKSKGENSDNKEYLSAIENAMDAIEKK